MSDREDDNKTAGQTQTDVDLKLDEKGEGHKKKSRTKSTLDREKKEKPTKKKQSLFNTLADKILGSAAQSKPPPTTRTEEREEKKEERREERKKERKSHIRKEKAMESPMKDEEPLTELPKNIKDFILSVLDIEKSQTLNKYYLNTLIKITPSYTFTSFNANMAKNQSPDVFCSEANRVKLTGPGVTADYIHANYVKFEGLKRTYIATQHPLKNTVEDFYSMIFAEEVDTIVSLSAAADAFPNYFPTEKDGFINLPRFSISCKFMKPESKNRPAEYTLDVLPTGCSNSLVVKVVKFSHWGKYQVPTSPRVVSSLLKATKKSRGPLVVQCETGVNQTAAFIFMDATLGLLDAGVTPTLEGLFKDLKTQRHSALSQRLHFTYAVFTTLVILKFRAVRANTMLNAECLKTVENMEKDMAMEFAKSTRVIPGESDDPKLSSKEI